MIGETDVLRGGAADPHGGLGLDVRDGFDRLEAHCAIHRLEKRSPSL